MDEYSAALFIQKWWKKLPFCKKCNGRTLLVFPDLCDQCYHYKYADMCEACEYGKDHYWDIDPEIPSWRRHR